MTYQPKPEILVGCLLGMAVGDALGLPREGLSRQRQRRLYADLKQHHLIGHYGLISDDTEHACMVAQSLIVSSGDKEQFLSQLAWRLRFWLLGLPASIGFATLRAILKLWFGYSGDRSGVFSAGNGPAMRSPLLGVCYGNDPQQLRTLVRASTRLTHSDPKAEFGALAVAVAAYQAGSQPVTTPSEYYQQLQSFVSDSEFLYLLKMTCDSVEAKQGTAEFVQQNLGLTKGISGYMYHTVPAVIHCWLSHQNDYQTAITTIIHLGGDTDTTAAILGSIVGAHVGKVGIPQIWLTHLVEWPRTVVWMEQLAQRLADVCCHRFKQTALPLPVVGLVLRNLIFIGIVLIHGFRRLLPPY